jgi:hypothetical protein
VRLKPPRIVLFGVPILAVAASAWLVANATCFQPAASAEKTAGVPARELGRSWGEFSGNRRGKVVFSRPPRMLILDLASGRESVVPGVETAGGPGRRARGASPRPSWAPDGENFVYRFRGQVYVCAGSGRRRAVANSRMDRSDETRWTWHRANGIDWLAGPALDGDVILVKVSDPREVRTALQGGQVRKHCEITGSGRYVVYDDGAHVRVAPFAGRGRGLRISQGQSCRPCAAADDRVAWLPAPHDRYRIFGAADGRFVGDLLAPPAEEIYRLNWSNLPDFAVHMYGADGNSRMHVRKISNGARLFIGSGWDPDLWIGP